MVDGPLNFTRPLLDIFGESNLTRLTSRGFGPPRRSGSGSLPACVRVPIPSVHPGVGEWRPTEELPGQVDVQTSSSSLVQYPAPSFVPVPRDPPLESARVVGISSPDSRLSPGLLTGFPPFLNPPVERPPELYGDRPNPGFARFARRRNGFGRTRREGQGCVWERTGNT